jgi:hypothetical protein
MKCTEFGLSKHRSLSDERTSNCIYGSLPRSFACGLRGTRTAVLLDGRLVCHIRAATWTLLLKSHLMRHFVRLSQRHQLQFINISAHEFVREMSPLDNPIGVHRLLRGILYRINISSIHVSGFCYAWSKFV